MKVPCIYGLDSLGIAFSLLFLYLHLAYELMRVMKKTLCPRSQKPRALEIQLLLLVMGLVGQKYCWFYCSVLSDILHHFSCCILLFIMAVTVIISLFVFDCVANTIGKIYSCTEGP